MLGHVVSVTRHQWLRLTRGISNPTKAAVISPTEHLRVELAEKCLDIGTTVLARARFRPTSAPRKLRPTKYQVDSPFRDRNLPHAALPDNLTGEELLALIRYRSTVDGPCYLAINRLYTFTSPQFIGSW